MTTQEEWTSSYSSSQLGCTKNATSDGWAVADNQDGTWTLTNGDNESFTACTYPIKTIVVNGEELDVIDNTVELEINDTLPVVDETGKLYPIDSNGSQIIPLPKSIIDCDGNGLTDGDQIARKLVKSSGTAYPTDGNGNQVIDIAPADGSSVPGMSDATGLVPGTKEGAPDTVSVDVDGNVLPANSSVINYYDGEGNYLYSYNRTQSPHVELTLSDDSDLVNMVDPVSGVDCDVSTAVPVLCDDSAIAKEVYKPLTVEQGHAPYIWTSDNTSGIPIDPDCIPDLPECPIEGMGTHEFNQYGSMEFRIRNGAWICVDFSPWSDELSYQGGNSPNFTDPELQSTFDSGEPQVIGNPITRTITNEDCFCLSYRAEVRCQVNWQNFTNDNQFTAQLRHTTNDSTQGSWLGSPESILDTTQYDASSLVAFDQQDLLFTANVGVIAPGQTMVFEHEVVIEGNDYASNPSAIQRLQASGIGGRIMLFRKPC